MFLVLAIPEGTVGIPTTTTTTTTTSGSYFHKHFQSDKCKTFDYFPFPFLFTRRPIDRHNANLVYLDKCFILPLFVCITFSHVVHFLESINNEKTYQFSNCFIILPISDSVCSTCFISWRETWQDKVIFNHPEPYHHHYHRNSNNVNDSTALAKSALAKSRNHQHSSPIPIPGRHVINSQDSPYYHHHFVGQHYSPSLASFPFLENSTLANSTLVNSTTTTPFYSFPVVSAGSMTTIASQQLENGQNNEIASVEKPKKKKKKKKNKKNKDNIEQTSCFPFSCIPPPSLAKTPPLLHHFPSLLIPPSLAKTPPSFAETLATTLAPTLPPTLPPTLAPTLATTAHHHQQQQQPFLGYSNSPIRVIHTPINQHFSPGFFFSDNHFSSSSSIDDAACTLNFCPFAHDSFESSAELAEKLSEENSAMTVIPSTTFLHSTTTLQQQQPLVYGNPANNSVLAKAEKQRKQEQPISLIRSETLLPTTTTTTTTTTTNSFQRNNEAYQCQRCVVFVFLGCEYCENKTPKVIFCDFTSNFFETKSSTVTVQCPRCLDDHNFKRFFPSFVLS